MMQPEGFVDPFMDWCKPLGVGINALIVSSKHLGSYNVYEKLVFPKE